MLLRNLLVPCLMLLLAGCAGLGPRESVEGSGNPQDWAMHKEQVSEIDGWQISGKIGIRAPQESGSGTLFWLQRQEYFDIRLSGPLGRGATRGLPAPDSRSRLSLDGQSRLAMLQQDGWDVEYLGYTEENDYALPSRIKLSGHDLQITLVIKDWQPRQLGQ